MSITKKRVGCRMFRKLTIDRLTKLRSFIEACKRRSLSLCDEEGLSALAKHPLIYGLSKQGVERISAMYGTRSTTKVMTWFCPLVERECKRQGVKA